jgi:hypothetical protein
MVRRDRLDEEGTSPFNSNSQFNCAAIIAGLSSQPFWIDGKSDVADAE